jgi:hypothetical protein
MGVFFKKIEIDETAQTSRTKKWHLDGTIQSCLPRVGWPCYRTWGFTIDYLVDLSPTGEPILWPGTIWIDSIGVAIFRTP